MSANDIWVFSENQALTLELLGKGRELADKLQKNLIAVIINSNQTSDAQMLIDYGADIVYVIDAQNLVQYSVESYSQVLTSLVTTNKPQVLLIGATKSGRELAPRLAIRLKTGCVLNCIAINLDSQNQIVMNREVYGGRAIASEICQKTPIIATIPPKTFEPCERKNRSGEIIEDSVEIVDTKSKLIEFKKKKSVVESLVDAKIVITGGRGLKQKEDSQLLEELATVLQGRVGWTRPVVEDLKWFPEIEWIGLSGEKIAPSLNILVGVSGAIQHLAGVRGSKIIVAINSDPNAPIFEYADYGVVGDLYEIVPILIEAIKEHK